MSLLNTASPWKGCSTQKRTPSIGKRRTQRLPQPQQDDDAAGLADLEEQDEISDQLKTTMTANDERSTAVNDMLNRITADPIDSGSGLADFKPVVKSRSFMDNLADLMPTSKEGFESDLLRRASSSTALPNDLQSHYQYSGRHPDGEDQQYY